MTTISTDTGPELPTRGPDRGPRHRGRRGLHLAVTTVLALTAAAASYGWYQERRWVPDLDPSTLADNRCTIEDDMLLTYEFTQEPGDVLSVRVVSERDRVVIGYRTEWPEGGDRAGVGTTGRYSVLIEGGLRGQPVVYDDGTVLPCDAVDRAGAQRYAG